MINVIIVDDHQFVRVCLKRLLEDAADIKVMGEAASGEEALKIVRQKKPDVVLLDIRMAGLDGLTVTYKLSRVHQDIKILIVTSYDNEIFPARIMAAGALGYLLKGASTEELIKAIKTVAKGEKYLSPEIANLLAFRSANKEKHPFEHLNDHEIVVMLMTAQGFEPTDIAKKLHLSPKTINGYRCRMFKAFNIRNDVGLTHFALAHGLIDEEDMD